MTHPVLRLALPGVLLAAAGGCISVGGTDASAPPRVFDLRPPLAGEPVPAAGPETLALESFTCDPALDREEMVWERGDVEAGAYSSWRWARPPAEALRDLCADALRRAGVCAVVAADPAPASPDFVLRAHLARLAERDGGESWSGVVELRVVVVSTADGAEILRRSYSEREPCPERNPRGTAVALAVASARLTARLSADVGAALERVRLAAHLWKIQSRRGPASLQGRSRIAPSRSVLR